MNATEFDVDVDLAYQLFLRVCSKRNQRRYQRNWNFKKWKFKYKQKQFLNILCSNEQHEVRERQKIMCKMRLRKNSWERPQYRFMHKKTQRMIKCKFKTLILMIQSHRSDLLYKLKRLEISRGRRIFYVDVQFFLKHKWRFHNDSDLKFCGKCKTEQKQDKFTISFGQIKKKNQSIIDADIDIQAVLEMVLNRCNVFKDSPKTVCEHERLDLVALNQIEAFNRLENQIGVLSKLIMALRSYLWRYLQHLIAMTSIGYKFENVITRRELLRKETIRVVHYAAIHMIMDREIHTLLKVYDVLTYGKFKSKPREKDRGFIWIQIQKLGQFDILPYCSDKQLHWSLSCRRSIFLREDYLIQEMQSKRNEE